MNTVLPSGLRCALLATALLASGAASAADELLTMPIDKALESQAAKERIDPSVKLLFGFNKLEGAQYARSFKTVKRIRRPVDQYRGGAPAPTDADLCATVFVQAVQELQQRAGQEGGNAVTEIRSNWKDDETSSDRTYVCAKGGVYIGVALKAMLVKAGG